MGNILMISENDSIWTRQIIEKSDIISKHKIYVLSTGESKNDQYYIEKGIHISRIKKQKAILKNIPIIRRWVFLHDYIQHIKSLTNEVKEFDVVHINYIRKEKVRAIKYLRPFAKRIVCTFWGSDLLRKSNEELLVYKENLKMVDVITLSTPEMKNKLLSALGNEFQKKVQIVRFGVEGLQYICPDADNNNESKKLFSIPVDKTVITIGYNGLSSQNHIEVIDIIKEMPRTIKERIFIQLPVTYGLLPDYKQTLIDHLETLQCEYQLIDSFLDNTTLGKLRESSDVFIHSQKSDASSASVQEYLYAQKVVFSPSWIQYQCLKNNNVFFYEYSDFAQLGEMIFSLFVKGIDTQDRMKFVANTDIIRNLSSWDVVSENGKRFIAFKKTILEVSACLIWIIL